MIKYDHKFKIKKHSTKAKYHGPLVFMCTKCHELTTVNADVNFKVTRNDDANSLSIVDLQVTTECLHCGFVINQYMIEDALDPNIAPIISTINKKGYRTKYSCEGHANEDEDGKAYVVFELYDDECDEYAVKMNEKLLNALKHIEENTNGEWILETEDNCEVVVSEDYCIRATHTTVETNGRSLITLEQWVNKYL